MSFQQPYYQQTGIPPQNQYKGPPNPQFQGQNGYGQNGLPAPGFNPQGFPANGQQQNGHQQTPQPPTSQFQQMRVAGSPQVNGSPAAPSQHGPSPSPSSLPGPPKPVPTSQPAGFPISSQQQTQFGGQQQQNSAPQYPSSAPQQQNSVPPQASFGMQPPQPNFGMQPPQLPGAPSGPTPQQFAPNSTPAFPAAPGGRPGIPAPMGQPAMPQQQGFPPMGMAMPGSMPQQPMGFSQQGQPGMPPGPPSMPGMPGVPQMPGMPSGAPTMPGMPGVPQMPGMPPGAPGMGGYPQQPARQRLDPNAMPSAVAVMEDDAVRAGLFPTGFPHAESPPLISTEFFSQDQGNCNPRLMRSTLYVAPASNDLLKNSNLPFAVACSPFAKLHPKEYEPPVIDLGPGGPVRCQRCKAYMCPFMEFQDGGRRFRCPFCQACTPVEDNYFAHLDHTGRRTDIEHRPELYLGAYDFVATKPYCKNGIPPKEPAYIFMIDVSYNACSSGMLQVLCHNLEKVLSSLPKESNQDSSSIRVGLATFDQAVHFYDLSSSTPSMMVVGDVDEMFVPIVDGLLVPYNEGAASIKAVLNELPKLFSQNKVTETILGPVVSAGLDALKCADRAGKLFIFSTSLPLKEAPGKLKTKNDRALLGTDKEKAALTPQTEYYTKVGENCVKAGVTVDLFLFPNSFIDVATVAQLSAVTGGSVYKYQYFSAEKDTQRFMSDLHADVSRKIGFDCMVRVRSSAGIRPVTFSGSFYMENSTDLELATMDEDKCFFAELKHDDKLSDPAAVIQCAVLYTSMSGQRRLRILNLCLAVSSDYNQLYRVADPDTLTSYLLKIAVQINRDKGNKEVRDIMTKRTAQILASYREKCSEGAPLGQLILPETLKLLPLFVNSILKNDAISGGAEMTPDDKAWMIELIRGMRIQDCMKMLYPRVYPVSELEISNAAELTVLPTPVRASSEFMTNDKAYLIDNGYLLFLWVGTNVKDEWVQQVFGANNVQQMNTEEHVIPERDNSKSRALRRCIQLLEKGIRTRKTYVIRQGDGLEPWFKKTLIEDKTAPSALSYVEYLCCVHREIREMLS